MKNNAPYLFFRYCAVGLLSGLLGCGQSPKDNKPIDLSFHPPLEASFVYYYYTHQEMEQSMMQMNTHLDQKSELEATFFVSAADSNSRGMTVIYRRFYISSSASGTKMEYDSRDSLRQPSELAGISALLNRPFTMRVEKNGNSTLTSADHSALPPVDRSFQQQVQESLNIYPDAAVKKGDSWKKQQLVTAGFMDMQLDAQYTLQSVNDSIIAVVMIGHLMSRTSQNPQIRELQPDIKGTQTGTLLIFRKTGVIKDAQLQQSLKGTIRLSGTKVPVSFESEIRVVGRMTPR